MGTMGTMLALEERNMNAEGGLETRSPGTVSKDVRSSPRRIHGPARIGALAFISSLQITKLWIDDQIDASRAPLLSTVSHRRLL